MRVVYIAKHGSGGNDDEGAILHALRELGCEVICIHETQETMLDRGQDLTLFHHWRECERLSTVRSGVKAFWCFDLIDWHIDATLEPRNRQRREWAAKATALCDLGFMTDGDWVAKDTTGKLHWLPQGADGRIVGQDLTGDPTGPLLFTGISRGGGVQRESFVAEMTQKHKTRFNHITKNMYREELRHVLGRLRIYVCPDSPVTDRYWSNRVYNACGFGAFVLHPYCRGLAEQYEDGKEIVFYNDRKHLHQLIGFWLEDDLARRRIGTAALERTKAQHTYLRRCEVLLATVKGMM